MKNECKNSACFYFYLLIIVVYHCFYYRNNVNSVEVLLHFNMLLHHYTAVGSSTLPIY